MEFVLLLVMGVVLFQLWTRVGELERKERHLDQVVDALQWRVARLREDAGSQATGRKEKPLGSPDEEADSPAETDGEASQEPQDPAPATASPSAPKPRRKSVAAPAQQEPVAVSPMPQEFRKDRAAEVDVITSDPADAAGEEDEASDYRTSLDFEYIFGKLLPIWAGGIALAVAGFFLVRWSIETGLLNEYVRVGLGFAFGSSLIAAAEGALRLDRWIADARVRQALAGAGIATLYASFYFAGSFYGLMPVWLAFAGLAGTTALALYLSYRFGLPAAVLGLVGGFAAPVMAGGSEPNLPILATYLALVTGGLVHTGERQGRSWLSLAAFAGALIWGVVLLFSAPLGAAEILTVGSYLVVVGTLLPALMGQSSAGQIGRLAAGGIATLQIAALVDRSGYDPLAWGTYVLLAAAIVALGWRNSKMREAGGVAAALSLSLLLAWPEPASAWLVTIAASLIAIFIIVPLVHVWRRQETSVDWAQLAAYPVGLVGVLCMQLGLSLPDGQHMLLALVASSLALAPAAAAMIVWPSKLNLNPVPLRCDPDVSSGVVPQSAMWCLASTGLLLGLAGLFAVPGWAAPFVTLALAAVWFALFHCRQESGFTYQHWAFAVAGVVLLLATAHFAEIEALFGDLTGLESALCWIATAIPFVLITLLPHQRQQRRWAHRGAQVLAALLSYGALSQVMPLEWRPLCLTVGVLVLAWRMHWRAAHATWLGVMALFTAPPLLDWTVAAAQAVIGQPMFAFDASMLEATYRNLLPLAVAWVGSLLLTQRFFSSARVAGWSIAGAMGVVLLHVSFKQIFQITDLESFAALGMAERSLWQAVLALPAIALLILPRKWDWQVPLGTGLACTALAHFVWFTGALHNPLWDAQEVGTLPLLNLLAVTYGLAIASVFALRQQSNEVVIKLRPVLDAFVMLAIGMLCLSELRHVYSGTLLTAVPLSSGEDLARSILAIGLALGFLAIGHWKNARSWRIGSLVLMLAAVVKVFLFDAAGLEGLARIVSFFALGMCLIGIGWFYSRQLSRN